MKVTIKQTQDYHELDYMSKHKEAINSYWSISDDEWQEIKKEIYKSLQEIVSENPWIEIDDYILECYTSLATDGWFLEYIESLQPKQ